MKLRELKNVLDKLTSEQLEQELCYVSNEYGLSGAVNKIVKAKSNLYWAGDDDPSQLYTKKELLEEGYDKDEIGEMTIEISKGDFYINL
jgi:hypothetical protein